jgi:hypothetical protein
MFATKHIMAVWKLFHTNKEFHYEKAVNCFGFVCVFGRR